MIDNPIRMTKRALMALPEYSTTLPTGTTPGQRWRRDAYLDGREWWQGRYGKPIPNPDPVRLRRDPAAMVVPIAWRRIIVQGEPARWPRGVTVNPRGQA